MAVVKQFYCQRPCFFEGFAAVKIPDFHFCKSRDEVLDVVALLLSNMVTIHWQDKLKAVLNFKFTQ